MLSSAFQTIRNFRLRITEEAFLKYYEDKGMGAHLWRKYQSARDIIAFWEGLDTTNRTHFENLIEEIGE